MVQDETATEQSFFQQLDADEAQLDEDIEGLASETVPSSPEGRIPVQRSVVQFEGYIPRRSQPPLSVERIRTPSQRLGILRSSSVPRLS